LPITLTATYHQRPDIAQFLVEKGARLDLYTAVAIGELDMVQELINSGYKAVDDFNLDGFNPLQLACFFNQETTALWLIEQGADVNAVNQNKNSIRPVHAAAAGGNLTILSALLAAGANPNQQQAGGFTPMHTAAQNNNPAMTALLLMHGADPNIANDQGQIPHECAPNR
ncbi:MAG: ankyrin repeat domain-containing protein, partial [Anaerolineales bacterium]|nr:ankyrin repeat domain-containing protein [Anaerolineales bacterium]